jgi:hypothetical protein
MQVYDCVERGNKVLVGARAYRGDAMTLLAFDLDESKLDGFVGFSIQVSQGDRPPYYLLNKLTFPDGVLAKSNIDRKAAGSTLYSPIQKFRWVHVPAQDHYVGRPYFGMYTYHITPRYLKDQVLLAPDPNLTVHLKIEVSPFCDEDIQVGFTRAFVSSQAYAAQFGNSTKMRPNDQDLIFDVTQVSGTAMRWDESIKAKKQVPYTFEEQFKYLGWQARDRIMEFLDEALKKRSIRLDVFAFDLDEPAIARKLFSLAKQGRLRIILDNSDTHIRPTDYETRFEEQFPAETKSVALHRGHFQTLAHSKVFIQRNKKTGKAIKVLTGSTNFTTSGMYINANHVLIFNHPKAAQLYADAFDLSFGDDLMRVFRDTALAAGDQLVQEARLPDMTIRFSPHKKAIATRFFQLISGRIKAAKSDVLFAIMDDDSNSSILDAVQEQVKSDKVFTYGITDNTSDTFLYKPDSKTGIKVSGRGTESALPPPFDAVAKVPGHNIHHKFIVVDFKGKQGVVYCGSSNLAFEPEQKNGDNLIEIRDEDVVTAFAVEAIRLVDHFQWRNKEFTAAERGQPVRLNDLSDPKKIWYKSYYAPDDLHYLERTLLVRENLKD